VDKDILVLERLGDLQMITPYDFVERRRSGAFLNSYAPEDEGLYDDYPSR
jgi:hypothetical protein